MLHDFRLTEQDIENAEMYDQVKNNYISQFLIDFFKSKKIALENHVHSVECFDHGMERFTILGEPSFGIHGFCFDQTFEGWENTLSLHWNAKFNCGEEFPIGFYFVFRYKDLINVTKKLFKLNNLELVSDLKFDEKNKLTIITGFRQNKLI